MRVIIFGLGNIYSQIKHYIYEASLEVVALVDNSQSLIGSLVDGYVVESLEHIGRYSYDYIILASDYAVEMKKQIIKMRVEEKKLIHYKDYMGSIPQNFPVAQKDSFSDSVLILSNEFGYHGGPIVCLGLAHVLAKQGYSVTIAVPQADSDFVEEVSSEDFRVDVVDNLAFLSTENLQWTDKYDYIIANTNVMARCAVKLARKRRVYLWLHESIDSYTGYEYWYEEILEGIKADSLVIGAVSDVARKNFGDVYRTKKAVEIMPYGIEDRYEGKDSGIIEDVMTFAVVANQTTLKGLDVLLDALHLLSADVNMRIRVLVAGKTIESDYGARIRHEMEQHDNCIYMGELSREKIFELYRQADAVIVPSRRESMSLVTTEAMMLKKPCVISDSIGMARYVIHKINGLVFKNEDAVELASLISWCLENGEELEKLGENARKTYEKWFTMERFGDRVMNVIARLR